MIYSVFDPGSRSYDYYQTAAAPPAGPPDPGHLRSKDLGLAGDEAAWPLPAGAKWVGRGPVARGRVARKGGSPLSGIASGNTLPLLGFGVAAYLLWKANRRGRARR